MIFGLIAWWLFEESRAERSLLNAVIAAMFLAVAVYGIVLPSLTTLFPSAGSRARAAQRRLRRAEGRRGRLPRAESRVHDRHRTLLTDGSGAADFLGQGTCRFALVESRSERGFVQRAEAIGLRYNVATRIEGYNISQGKAISIAIFRSEGTE